MVVFASIKQNSRTSTIFLLVAKSFLGLLGSDEKNKFGDFWECAHNISHYSKEKLIWFYFASGFGPIHLLLTDGPSVRGRYIWPLSYCKKILMMHHAQSEQNWLKKRSHFCWKSMEHSGKKLLFIGYNYTPPSHLVDGYDTYIHTESAEKWVYR